MWVVAYYIASKSFIWFCHSIWFQHLGWLLEKLGFRIWFWTTIFPQRDSSSRWKWKKRKKKQFRVFQTKRRWHQKKRENVQQKHENDDNNNKIKVMNQKPKKWRSHSFAFMLNDLPEKKKLFKFYANRIPLIKHKWLQNRLLWSVHHQWSISFM